jgi:hypothetical protein
MIVRGGLMQIGVVAAALSAALIAQEAPSPIHGRVVADDGGGPLRNAFVALEGSDRPPAMTDGDGRFTIEVQDRGQAFLSAWKTGYAMAHARVVDDIEIRLQRGAAITGWVRDDFSQPLPSVRVVAGRRITGNGNSRFEEQASAWTDDTGAYRLFGLTAGAYVVGVIGLRSVPGGPPVTIAEPTPQLFYPNTPDVEEALTFDLAVGAEISGADLTLRLPPVRPSGTPLNPFEPDAGAQTTGAIRGRVTDTAGFPVRNAAVRLSLAGRLFTPSTTPTDDDGRYAFEGLAPGSYRVEATDSHFQRVAFGQGSELDRGTAIPLQANAVVDRVDIVMPLTGTITGRIVDENGEPIEFADIRVEELQSVSGRWRLAPTPFPARFTDDHGEFRLYGVTPGKHVISATVKPRAGSKVKELTGYVKTYYPGTPLATQARIIEGVGEVNVGDIVITRGNGRRVAGRAIGADGQPFTGEVDLIASARSRAPAPPRPERFQTYDGAFEFKNLASGEYVIQAATPSSSPSTEGEFGMMFVAVADEDAADIIIRLSAGSSIAGRVTFENAVPPSDVNLEVAAIVTEIDALSLAGKPVARARINDDWSFEMHGVNGPRRLEPTRTPEGWMLKSVSVHGVDVTDRPLLFGAEEQSLSGVEVVLTNRVTEVVGVVSGQNGEPLVEGMVVAFATDPGRWYPQSRFVDWMRIDSDGRYTLRGLPPGDYYLKATMGRDEPRERPDLDNPDVLRGLIAGASRATVTEDSQRIIDLRVTH